MICSILLQAYLAAIVPLIALAAPQGHSSSGTETVEDLENIYQPIISKYYADRITDNPLTSNFYLTADNFSGSLAPGKALKLNHVSNSSLSENYEYPPGLNLYRIQYTSENITGDTIPATGFVLLPYEQGFKGGKETRTVVWTHGTSGGTRACAPSGDYGLMYNWRTLYYLSVEGYVVIAPDYAGQGAEGPFHYMSAVEHAHDAGNMVMAVREAMPSVGVDEWVVVGHSEGGMTAWVTNSVQKKEPVSGFLGSVALAPSLSFSQTFANYFTTPEKRKALVNKVKLGTMYSLFVLRSIEQLNSIQPARYLTEIGLRLYQIITKNGCDWDAPYLLERYSLDEIYSNYSWASSPEAASWINYTQNDGQMELAKPMRIIQGTADTDVPIQDTISHYDRHCAKFNNAAISFFQYPHMDHAAIQWAAYSNYNRFIDDLFNHVEFAPECNMTVTEPAFPRENTALNYKPLPV